ncbi:MAG TPA: hypothetical protein VLX90_22630, partial [Steroidobacteraceae bacterium]|nr:hypothetical protein [Steroidobacteraceae bacterium]
MALRFGVHCTASLAPWQLDSLRRLFALAGAQAALLILTDPDEVRPTVPAELKALPVLSGLPDRISRTDLDFILSFGDPEAARELCECARWGVWRHEIGDWEHRRGGRPGYWEVHSGEPESFALLVRVTPDPDAVIVLREACVRTAILSAPGNRAQLERICTPMAAQVCIDILHGETQRLAAPMRRATTPPRRQPNRLEQLICAVRIIGRKAREAWQGLFRHTQWNVGIAEAPIASFVGATQLPRVRWLPTPPRSAFRADPFGYLREGKLTILYEDFDYPINRGTITALSVDTGRTVPVHIGPQPPVHLSYPYLFEVDGRLLCLPEAHESGELVLYELEREPDRWRPLATLALDRLIVDATPFRHEDYWWIAGSEPGIKGASNELLLWYAREITGPWTPHPGNPVKVDIRSARPAGTPFWHNGALHRPAQDCSRSYGGRIVI